MKKSFWQDKHVVVTGGTGFLGQHVVKLLKKLNLRQLVIPRHKEYDLRQQADAAVAVKDADIVIHLAANVGGIGYNKANPGSLFYDNLLMGTHVMEESRKAGVAKFVGIGTVCAYPKYTQVPFKEKDLWEGYPEETNASYGLSKKMLLVQGQAYRQQYDFNAIHLLPVNMYGPGDDFNPESSHVIPALIRRFYEAQQTNSPSITIWGTGKATREFLYVEDAAKGILLATEKYNGAEPVNLGSSFEISIKELAETIRDIVGYQGKLEWDTTKPDGQPRRKLDTSLAEKEFNFKAETTFEEGLKKTIAWYKTHATEL